MPLLSRIARSVKARTLLGDVHDGMRILEVGCGDGWLRDWLHRRHRCHYVGLDVVPPADVVGSIEDWQQLGLQPGSFDRVVAFEVLEHVACLDACWQLLRPGGALVLTTPVPERDPWLQRLERIGLTQARRSAHDHLVDVRSVPWDGSRWVRRPLGLSQWARMEKE